MQKRSFFTKKAIKSTVVWTTLSALLTVYILYHIIAGFNPALDTGVTVASSERITAAFDAYIMRNETVLTATNTGFCDYTVGDGHYSKDEAELARVYASANENAVKRIAEIDAEYELLSECAKTLTDIGETKADVDAAYEALLLELSSSDLRGACAYIDTLLEDLYKLEHNTGRHEAVAEKIAASKARMDELAAERKTLCASFGEYESVCASGTGNFFHGTDGYEEIYSSADIDSMTLEDFSEMFAASPEKTEGAVGTYMKDYTWYIAIPADMSETTEFDIGHAYSVAFKYTSGVTLKMTLENIVRDGESTDAVMLFSTDTFPEGFDRTRRQAVEIEVAVYDGYRIPNEAITEIDGVPGVWILKAGKVTRRRVEVIYRNETYSIVRSQQSLVSQYLGSDEYNEIKAEIENTYPSLNDIYILSERGLYEGKLVD